MTKADPHSATLPDGLPLLNDQIARGHRHALSALAGRPGMRMLNQGRHGDDDAPAPTLLHTTIDTLLIDPHPVLTECFGPTSIVVTYEDEDQMLDAVPLFDGQLTATLVAEPDDKIVTRLSSLLARKAGRLLWNQWPTGVSVTFAQTHGGPYPATTAASTTPVGTAAISRFVRPVSWQNFPQHLLPTELRDDAAVNFTVE